MLNEYNERLRALQAKIQQRARTDAMLRSLYAQRAAKESRVAELAAQLYTEQEDVDRLTGGFWSIYYAVIGKKAEMLEKERAEVLKASVQYDAAKEELENLRREIAWHEAQKRRFDHDEREYASVVNEKLEYMQRHGIESDRIADLQQKKSYLDGQIGEIDEAENVGRSVLRQLDRIAESLNSAEGWGKWDMFGGGALSAMAKHAHLDEAQSQIKGLERLLSRFRTELADVTVQADIQAQLDGFTRFADWFFDGFFVDWMVLSRIQESQSSLRTTERQVQRVMEQLHKMRREMVRAQEKLDEEILRVAEDAK